MGRGGSACCGGDENEEDEVDYDPANKGEARDLHFRFQFDGVTSNLFQGQMRRDRVLTSCVSCC